MQTPPLTAVYPLKERVSLTLCSDPACMVTIADRQYVKCRQEFPHGIGTAKWLYGRLLDWTVPIILRGSLTSLPLWLDFCKFCSIA